MKQYKYRGWLQVVLIVLMLLYTVIAAVIAHRGHNDSAISWSPLMTVLIITVPQLVEQRRMTEAQWRAQNDERLQIITGKAAVAACLAGALAILGGLLYLALRDPENTIAGILLSVVLMASALAYGIATYVLGKKM
ncbi:MAG: hypothetical protein IJQ46_05360 [Oscillospiraceae bacterium]|nr:hypothetical protein [Oscillospiraceae bacterium]MBR0211798.1 hypothetical protein [Oscillospiraceae bacterium]